MRRAFGLRIGAILLAGCATGAQAMPMARASIVPGALTLVRDGCGPYAHRSRLGYCRPDGPEGGYGPGYGPVPGYGPPRMFGAPGYRYDGPRCFIRETYEGPRRICRY